jgi:hypothetical protein
MSDVFHPPPVSAGVGTPPVTNRYDTDTGGWVIFAGVNAIVQLLFIASNPFLSLALFSVDLLVIFGLIAYGGHRAEA